MLLLMIACSPGEVTVRGRVDSTRSEAVSRGLFTDGVVDLRDENGEVYATADVGDDGRVRVKAPAAQSIYADIYGPDHGVATFSGVSGIEPLLDVPDGTFYGVSVAQLDAWRAEFAGCPGADQPGGIVTGVIRVENLTDPETGENPLVNNASVSVTGALDPAVFHACYRGADGAYAADATITGEAGFFIVFGVPPGPATLEITYTVFTDPIVTYLSLWLPEAENAVAPRWPVWVDFTL
jgi:hypothetical protein